MPDKQTKKITILWGLPGSGKTHYATTHFKPEEIISGDEFLKYGSLAQKNLAKSIAHATRNKWHDMVVDSLITNNHDCNKLFQAIKDENKSWNIEFWLIWWQADIEACIHNDIGRRTKDSRLDIETTPFEKPHSDLIKLWNLADRVTQMQIIRKPVWKTQIPENKNHPNELRSDRWCTGGEWENCWGDRGTHSADKPLDTFTEFDKLLEKICPTISFLQYKKVYGECVTIKTEHESGYYGSYSDYMYYSCDLCKLHEKLKELGLVSSS